MDVEQSYVILDPAFVGAVAGAAQGWAETLDRLGMALYQPTMRLTDR